MQFAQQSLQDFFASVWRNKFVVFFGILSCILAYGVFNVFIYRYASTRIRQQKKLVSTIPSITMAPSATPAPLPHGKQKFSISSKNPNGPHLTSGWIDPYDPQRGQRQTLHVAVQRIIPTILNVTVQTDSGIKTYVANKVREVGESTEWEASWTMEDSYDRMYGMSIQAESTEGSGHVEISLR